MYPGMGFGQCVWHREAGVGVAACGLRETRTIVRQAGATAWYCFHEEEAHRAPHPDSMQPTLFSLLLVKFAHSYYVGIPLSGFEFWMHHGRGYRHGPLLVWQHTQVGVSLHLLGRQHRCLLPGQGFSGKRACC